MTTPDAADRLREAALDYHRLPRPGKIAVVPTKPMGTQLDRLLTQARAEVVPFTAEHAALACDGWRRYGKGRHPAGLNLGDCFAYALARSRGEPLLYKGDDFARTDVKAAR